MKREKLIFVLIALTIAFALNAQPIPYSKGRIAISCDGNKQT